MQENIIITGGQEDIIKELMYLLAKNEIQGIFYYNSKGSFFVAKSLTSYETLKLKMQDYLDSDKKNENNK